MTVGVEQATEIAISESQNLWPFLIYGLSVMTLLLTMLGLGWLWGTRTPHTDSTDLPFESGVIPVGSSDQTKFSIEFFLIAIFFVIFDLETIFVFAWAIAFFELGWQGYFAAATFILILLAGLVYEWRSGALDWGVLRRRSRRDYSLSTDSSVSAAGASVSAAGASVSAAGASVSAAGARISAAGASS